MEKQLQTTSGIFYGILQNSNPLVTCCIVNFSISVWYSTKLKVFGTSTTRIQKCRFCHSKLVTSQFKILFKKYIEFNGNEWIDIWGITFDFTEYIVLLFQLLQKTKERNKLPRQFDEWWKSFFQVEIVAVSNCIYLLVHVNEIFYDVKNIMTWFKMQGMIKVIEWKFNFDNHMRWRYYVCIRFNTKRKRNNLPMYVQWWLFLTDWWFAFVKLLYF